MSVVNKAWCCTVCGYVHRGTEPPEVCPVCGAPADLFQVQAESVQTSAPTNSKQWRCAVCGYVHNGLVAPRECPVCGATADCFEPVIKLGTESAETPAIAEGAMKVVIIGAGIAGISAAESLRTVSPTADISLLSKETELPYYRLNLTRLLAGEIGEQDLPIHPADWYKERKIQLRQGVEVTTFCTDKHYVELDGGEQLPFNKLLLAVGAHPFFPPIPGADLQGVTSLRTVGDALNILMACRAGAKCVCIGGGLLGLETAGGLARQGADVTLLEGFDWLLPRQLNRRAGELLAEFVATAGIKLKTKAMTTEIVGPGCVQEVLLNDGTRLAADLVVLATGVRSNSHLARQAGLEVDQGIVVNNHLATSHPDVFAAGDVAEHHGQLYGIWGPAQFQGNIAGMNIAGGRVEFGGIPRSNTLKVLGLDLFSIGQVNPDEAGFQILDEESNGRYYRLVFHDNRLVGSVLLGDTKLTSAVKNAVESGLDYSALLQKHPTALRFIDEAFLGPPMLSE
jgi:nitrite reductase (NADH) large subunit